MLKAVPALVAGLVLAVASPAVAQTICDPWTASFRGEVPTAQQVIGIDLGARDVTTAESDAYLLAVDRASARVTSGVAATSVEGRPLRYAIVGSAANVSAKGLERVRRSAETLMDPRTTATEAARVAAESPAILWIAGNVHGGEESGTDAALRVLYELADRNDCAATRILDEAVVVILPTQNPDGREADTRRNAYGFDMNRDWFARTQPETDGKIELLRRYPPVLFIDAHEMGNSAGYFFPPNADPVYHEIADEAVGWINDLYGAAMQDEFDSRGIPYFNYDVYDLFYAGYGDTVPANGFGAAGMTFEKTSSHPAAQRVFEQYLTQWTSLNEAAASKDAILRDWRRSWVEAAAQGESGVLEPNAVYEPGNEVVQEVPDIRVRHYFLRADQPAKTREVRALVRRLQRMDVEVRRLTAPLQVGDYTPYGRAARTTTLPAGTYWVPMAQRQKHWVQAMLHENSYTPVGYAYDVVGWSNPLLMNVPGGYSGAVLAPRSERASLLADPGIGAAPADQPEVALYSMSPQFVRGIESSGWLRWLLDQWGVEYRDVSAEDIAAGALAGAELLLVPDGYALKDPAVPSDPYGYKDLGKRGRDALVDWVSAGGRYVGWNDGALLASALGISSAQFTLGDEEGFFTPGSLFRIGADEDSPLADGVGPFAWAMHLGGYVMRSPDPAKVALRYPPAGSEDFFMSGEADGEAALGGTAAVIDERVGAGRIVSFGFEPNFRAFTDGTQRILYNAMFGADPAAAATARVAVRRRAAVTARRLRVVREPLRIVVRPRGAKLVRRLLARHGARYSVHRSRGRRAFIVANPGDRTGDEHPYARQLGRALRARHAPVVLFRAP
jgi:Zinc carboxypeptidase